MERYLDHGTIPRPKLLLMATKDTLNTLDSNPNQPDGVDTMTDDQITFVEEAITMGLVITRNKPSK
ncbi:hypothetical protein LCGC14_0378800 [marine sediment metagenome]|uniref:Uncharacterized protein n=1 Tax=marine sediment metagenome TaxID=412755 RepID=A0A0F9TL45_9ZZZZ